MIIKIAVIVFFIILYFLCRLFYQKEFMLNPLPIFGFQTSNVNACRYGTALRGFTVPGKASQSISQYDRLDDLPLQVVDDIPTVYPGRKAI
jgi:hypothetical protein